MADDNSDDIGYIDDNGNYVDPASDVTTATPANLATNQTTPSTAPSYLTDFTTGLGSLLNTSLPAITAASALLNKNSPTATAAKPAAVATTPAQKQQYLLYGGVAAAVLAVLFLFKRK